MTQNNKIKKVEIAEYDKDPERVVDVMKVYIIGNVKRKPPIGSKPPKEPSLKKQFGDLKNQVVEIREILLAFIKEQRLFNRNIVKLNNLRTK
ncbi:MAG: hypothetical protein LBQ45_02325 [Mycoplasmataceae bacterium]|jgi:hypothetical protein|nr:hypothetical protein [Mycoplasmataceae bacterium]